MPDPYRETPIRRTFWDMDWERTSSDPYEQAKEHRWRTEEKDASLVSSLTESGLHAPAIDIDFPVECLKGDMSNVLLISGPPVWAYRWRHLLTELNANCLLTTEHLTRSLALVNGVFSRLTVTPTLIIDAPIMVFPSTTAGHFHLYVEQEIPWEGYLSLLKAFMKAGIVEKGYFQAAKARKMTMLVKPGRRNPRKVAEELAPPF